MNYDNADTINTASNSETVGTHPVQGMSALSLPSSLIKGRRMKRFTEAFKWNDKWFRRLSPSQKLFWLYICDNCDNAGVWAVDYELASFQIGVDVSEKDVSELNNGKDRVLFFCNDEKLLIREYVNFQIGNLKSEKQTNLQKNCKSLIYKYINEYGLTENDFMLTGSDGVSYDIVTGIGKGIGNSKGISNGNIKEGGLGGEKTKKLSSNEICDFESLFTYWEQNKSGKKYKTEESRARMKAKLIQLTGNDLSYAKNVIMHCIDSGYHGFSNGSELYYKGEKPQQKTPPAPKLPDIKLTPDQIEANAKFLNGLSKKLDDVGKEKH